MSQLQLLDNSVQLGASSHHICHARQSEPDAMISDAILWVIVRANALRPIARA
jgi:hypothetical protein